MVDQGVSGAELTGRGGLFVNAYLHALDKKRRLIIPSDWRENVGAPPRIFVLPAGRRKCLLCYPERDMNRRIERVRSLPLERPEDRIMARTILASMSDLVPWDAQGRIRIKDELLAHAGLDTEAKLVGSFEGFEIWNPEAWTQARGAVDAQRLLQATEALDE